MKAGQHVPMPKSTMFLTPAEVAELTGINRRTVDGPLGERQSAALLKMGVPHYINEIGRVIVVRARIESNEAPATGRLISRGMDFSKIK